MLEFKTPEIRKISDILKSIHKVCGEKGIEFEYVTNGNTNEVTFDQGKKKITFILPNLEEKNLIENMEHWMKVIKTTL
jgi:hypothetical protein